VPGPLSVDELLALAEGPDEAARQRLAPVLGDQRPFDNRHWSEFPARALVAYVLLSTGQQELAFELASRSLLAGKADDLSWRLIDNGCHTTLLDVVKALHRRRPDMATHRLRTTMARLDRVTGLDAARRVQVAIDFAQSASARWANPPAPHGRPTIIHLAIWGERFIDMAARTVLPCCLAAGNVPMLAAYGAAFLHIHTRAPDVDRIRALPVTQALAQHARIEITVIPEELLTPPTPEFAPSWMRIVAALLQYDGLMRARSVAADFVPMAADALLSGAALSSAKQLLAAGYEAVSTVPIRSVTKKMFAWLAAHGYRRTLDMDVPSDTLYQANLETLHPFVRASFMRRTPTAITVDPVQFYFKTAQGFAAHCFHQLPLMVSTRRLPPDFVCDFHTLDTRFLSDVLAGLDRSRSCYVQHQMPGDMFCVGLDDEDEMAKFGVAELSPAGAASAITYWIDRYEDLEHFVWAIRQRFEHPVPPGLQLELPADTHDETTAVDEIVQRLTAQRIKIFEELRRYRQASIAPAPT
jgi:hypothetical protein